MNSRNRAIVKGYLWTATTLGVVLGPGVDTAPLALLWVGGFVHLAKEAQLEFDQSEISVGVGGLLSAFGAWYVNGKIAGFIAAALAAAAFTGFGMILAALGALSLNATINALFTYRFLAASASVMENHDACGVILFRTIATTSQSNY